MSLGCTCSKEPPLCDGCVESAYDHLAGTAAARGTLWADRVAKEIAPGEPWPVWEASSKVRDRAARLVAELSQDERVRDLLARRCVVEAARRWSKLV